ncbi:MAG: 3-isopropylmalate dehydratase [Proteobacteria bacterium]|nr:3-isopropylmalate dehydratase [Pseudomonadota bacterium]
MENIIKASIYVLGDNVDTDQIIPAEYLAISLSDPTQRARYGGLALSGVPKNQAGLPSGNVTFADTKTNRSPFSIIVAGRNFGCGSSREHAPVALAEAGVRAVVARSYARIFFRNAINGGYFPPLVCEDDLPALLSTGDEIVLDMGVSTLSHEANNCTYRLNDMGAAGEIISAGGLFAYARGCGLA